MDLGKSFNIIKCSLVSFFKKEKSFRMKSRLSTKNIIIITTVAALLVLAAAGCYYYFYFYIKPNFEDILYNNVTTSSMEEVEPGDALAYEVKYMNTGYRQVDTLNIIIPVPENTEPVLFSSGGKYDEAERTIVYTFNDIPREASGRVEVDLQIAEPLDNGTEIIPGDVILQYSIGEKGFEKILDSGKGHIVKSSPDLSSVTVSSADMNGPVAI